MTKNLILAAMLLAIPLSGALAQTETKPSSSTAPYGIDNPKPASAAAQGQKTSPSAPGGTGQTVVPGNNSTVAGDAKATRDTQTGGIGQSK